MLSAPKVVQSVIPETSTAECGKEAELSEIPVIMPARWRHMQNSLIRMSLYRYIVLFEEELDKVVNKVCSFYGIS